MRSGGEVSKLLAIAAALAVVAATASQASAVPIGQGVGTRIKYPTPFGANGGVAGTTGRGAASQQTANEALLRQFDTNGNGRLDTAERKAMQTAAAQLRAGGADLSKAQLLQQFDANGDGRLDANELKSAKAALSQGTAAGVPGLSGGGVQTGPQGFGQQGVGQQGVGQQGFGQQGVGGAAGPGAAKVGGHRPFGRANKQELLVEFDANGDGKLDAKERLTMKRTQNERRRAEAEEKKADVKPDVPPDAKADVKK